MLNTPFVFELLKATKEDDQWKLGGLVFARIAVGDILRVADEYHHLSDELTVIGMEIYGHAITEIDRGMTVWLTVKYHGSYDLRLSKYLY
jgi:hypothetical protein